MAFGAEFGRLVKARRGYLGFTQQELAVRAFGEESAKARISELENGHVNRPQAKTVHSLVQALEIDSDTIKGLQRPDHYLPDEMVVELNLTRDLLTELAWSFYDPDSPETVTDNYESYIREKARQFQSLKERVSKLADLDEKISNHVISANNAISSGNFHEAESILENAEELQAQERTLIEIRNQSEIRATRAETALLRNDVELAVNHFRSAARMFEAFDPLEGAKCRRKFSFRLFDNAMHFDGMGLEGALLLAEDDLRVYSDPIDRLELGKTHHNIATFLGRLGHRANGPDGEVFFENAVSAYSEALKFRTRQEYPDDWALTQFSMGQTLSMLGERKTGHSRTKALEQAVFALEQAQEVRSIECNSREWASIEGTKGIVLKNLGIGSAREEATAFLEKAISSFQAALSIVKKEENPRTWSANHHNLGTATQELGLIIGGKQGIDLLYQSVDALELALTERQRDTNLKLWSMTMNNLGNSLLYLGELLEWEDGIVYINKAKKALEGALEVGIEINEPVNIAFTSENLAKLHHIIALNDIIERKQENLNEAMKHIKNAIVFHGNDPEHERSKSCLRISEIIMRDLAKLPTRN